MVDNDRLATLEAKVAGIIDERIPPLQAAVDAALPAVAVEVGKCGDARRAAEAAGKKSAAETARLHEALSASRAETRQARADIGQHVSERVEAALKVRFGELERRMTVLEDDTSGLVDRALRDASAANASAKTFGGKLDRLDSALKGQVEMIGNVKKESGAALSAAEDAQRNAKLAVEKFRELDAGGKKVHGRGRHG